MNRMYLDVFAFYCPFRLLHFGWMDFVLGNGGSVPTSTTKWKFNYEGRLDEGGNLIPWQRYLYNTVFNQVFRDSSQAEAGLSDTNVHEILLKTRTFQNQLLETAPPTVTVPTDTSGAGTLDIELLKDAQADYRRERAEYFFGSSNPSNPSSRQYYEYLRRLGVQPGFEVDYSPRLIGEGHAQGEFSTVVDTGGTASTGSPSGFWNGRLQMKSFHNSIPEHGVVGVFAVVRLDLPQGDCNATPLSMKDSTEQYFGLEERTRSPHAWPDSLVADVVAPARDLYAPAFEDYRTPAGQMFAEEDTSGFVDNNYVITGRSRTSRTVAALRSFAEVDATQFFRNFIGNDQQVAFLHEVKGYRLSPVTPAIRNI